MEGISSEKQYFESVGILSTHNFLPARRYHVNLPVVNEMRIRRR
jgi:hypothetical protein